MIEVEKKFILSASDKSRLLIGAELLDKQIFTDIYYDTENFRLTSQDVWLRSRQGRFELKLPLHKTDEGADSYQELDDEEKIRSALNVPHESSLADSLDTHGYSPFGIFITTRSIYKHGQFTIDIDEVCFENAMYYNLTEIELMVHQKSEIKDAVERILAFARARNLSTAPVRGKVVEYLKRFKPNHYQVLLAAGVVKN